jgi:hypothetical protein
MSRLVNYVLASALIALPATVNSQAATGADSARRALARVRQEKREERREPNEPHPAIHAAIRSLEHAKFDLQHAAHDFGGHRADALRATDEAIRQLRIALEYDRK